MPVFELGSSYVFPAPDLAEPDGLLAIGGGLEPDRLLVAYAAGIFPWYSEGQPILWHSPDPRMVLRPRELKISKSMMRTLRHVTLEIRCDTAFREVIHECAAIPRPYQTGTWITPEMIDAYADLYERGLAHSVEAWLDDRMVGGLYGVALGGCFFGESMFSIERDASKVAFVQLVQQLVDWNFDLIDCQVYTDHLASMGAVEMARGKFLRLLRTSLQRETRRGPWSFSRPCAAVS
ncbi:MAG: leucyl/phenylalanyl-tRNA--protein transferase [Myxococcota bacterium]|nr:leucyl/phenylalanyl-tRNA--protein transferase [Myxococcota bacterium]